MTVICILSASIAKIIANHLLIDLEYFTSIIINIFGDASLRNFMTSIWSQGSLKVTFSAKLRKLMNHLSFKARWRTQPGG